MLLSVQACCWYALQAPPPMNDKSLHNSNPIARLLLSLKGAENTINANKFFAHIPQFLDSLDKSTDAANLFFTPISSILEYCLKYLEYIIEVNRESNTNQEIKAHFDRVFDTQAGQISQRYKSEYHYASLIGLPETGNPMFGIKDDELDSLLLEYKSADQTKTWFNDRHKLLFKVQDKNETVNILENWFRPKT